jgi:hypothetical protein
MAAAGMVIAMERARFVELATLRSTSQSAGGLDYRPSTQDAGALVRDPRHAGLAAVLMADKGSRAGTGLDNLVKLLRKFGVSSKAYGRGAAAKISMTAKSGRPVIAGVAWGGGGGHFVVIHGIDKGKYCILDPGHQGIVQTTGAGSTAYTAPYGLVGTFDECLIPT